MDRPLDSERAALLEADGPWPVGRDPRTLSRDELVAAGHQPMSPLKALRARCLDCCCGSPHEVRLCTATACPSWPFRMGRNPWRPPSDKQREQGRRLAAKRVSGKSEAHGSLASSNESRSSGP